MTSTEEGLWDRLDGAIEAPPGEAMVEEMRDLVRQAEAGDHRDLLISARLWLVQALIQWAPDAESFTEVLAAFVRCVALHTREGERFDEDDLDLLWQAFGAIGVVMVHLPDRPVEQIRAVLDDMRQRCRPDRDDLHLIYLLRLMLEGRVGNIAAADAALHRLRTLGTPEYMNPGGTVVAQARYLALLERDEEAIEAVQPLLSGQIPYEDEDDKPTNPLNHLACLLPSCLRTGRLEQAREIHQRTWRQLDSEEDIAANLEFCARSGNEERGLRILQRLFDDGGIQEYTEMRCTAATVLLARRMVELGRGAETFSFQSTDPGARSRSWTFAEHYAEGTKGTMDFARRMDECNGTTHQSQAVHALIHAEPIVDHLPLSPVAKARQRLAQVLRPSKGDARPEPEPEREDAGRLLDEAERASWLMAEHDEIRDLLDRHDAAAVGPLDDAREARRTELRAVVAERREEREHGFRRAAELYRRLPDEPRARFCLGRLGAWLCEEGRAEEGRPLVKDAAALLGAEGDRYERAIAALWTADLLEASEEVDAALAALRRAHDTVAEDGDDPARAALLRGTSLYERARILGPTIEHADTAEERRADDGGAGAASAVAAEVTAYARGAAEEFRAAGNRRFLAAAHLQRARVALVTGETETMLEAYREASLADPGGEATALAHAMRGEALLENGDAAAATVDLVEAVAAFSALGDPRAAYVRADLATAYGRCERWLDAAECAEEVLPALDEREEDLPVAMRTRWVLTQAYHVGLDRPDDAIRVLDAMIEREEGDSALSLLYERAGRILYTIDSDVEAAERFQAAADAYARADDPAQEGHNLGMRARALFYAGRPDDAFAALDEAQRVVEGIPVDSEDGTLSRGSWSLLAGELMAAADRYEDAVAHAEEAAQRFHAAERHEMAARGALMAAQLWIQIEEPDRARAPLRRVMDELPKESQQHTEAAILLTGLQDDEGRGPGG